MTNDPSIPWDEPGDVPRQALVDLLKRLNGWAFEAAAHYTDYGLGLERAYERAADELSEILEKS